MLVSAVYVVQLNIVMCCAVARCGRRFGAEDLFKAAEEGAAERSKQLLEEDIVARGAFCGVTKLVGGLQTWGGVPRALAAASLQFRRLAHVLVPAPCMGPVRSRRPLSI